MSLATEFADSAATYSPLFLGRPIGDALDLPSPGVTPERLRGLPYRQTASRFFRPRERLRCRSQITCRFLRGPEPLHADQPSVPTSKPIAPVGFAEHKFELRSTQGRGRTDG